MVSSGQKAVVFVEEFFGVRIDYGIWFEQSLEGPVLSLDFVFVRLAFQAFESVGFALHRQYPAGLLAGFVHAQNAEPSSFRSWFQDWWSSGRCCIPLQRSGLTLVARNDPPQPYRTLIPLMDGVREILSADRNKE